MKASCLLLSMLISLQIFSQKHTALPHGMVYGIKPDTAGIMNADKLEAFMGKKTRISTTIRGKVIRVTRQQGGWFELDAGNGKVISAHFSVYNISIPAELKGKTIIAEGVAQKQFIADDQQHFAGDTVTGRKQHAVKTDPKRQLTFEVKGLMVDH